MCCKSPALKGDTATHGNPAAHGSPRCPSGQPYLILPSCLISKAQLLTQQEIGGGWKPPLYQCMECGLVLLWPRSTIHAKTQLSYTRHPVSHDHAAQVIPYKASMEILQLGWGMEKAALFHAARVTKQDQPQAGTQKVPVCSIWDHHEWPCRTS